MISESWYDICNESNLKNEVARCERIEDTCIFRNVTLNNSIRDVSRSISEIYGKYHV